jgi:hypothetical protein
LSPAPDMADVADIMGFPKMQGVLNLEFQVRLSYCAVSRDDHLSTSEAMLSGWPSMVAKCHVDPL